MNIFPVVPLPHFLNLPRVAENHRVAAYLGGGLFIFFGIFIIILWVIGGTEFTKDLARQRIRDGFVFCGIGIVFLLFGGYAMAASVLFLGFITIYALIRGARIAIRGA